jgi:hypothetical protein
VKKDLEYSEEKSNKGESIRVSREQKDDYHGELEPEQVAPNGNRETASERGRCEYHLQKK